MGGEEVVARGGMRLDDGTSSPRLGGFCFAAIASGIPIYLRGRFAFLFLFSFRIGVDTRLVVFPFHRAQFGRLGMPWPSGDLRLIRPSGTHGWGSGTMAFALFFAEFQPGVAQIPPVFLHASGLGHGVCWVLLGFALRW